MTIDEKMERSRTARGDELWKLVRDSHPEVIMNTALNKNLAEEMALYLSKKKNTPSEILGMLANDIRFKDSYKLKLTICRNPKTPQKVTLSLLKYLRIFDLGDMTKDQSIPINIRQKIEYSLTEKISSFPLGNKIALAKRSSSNVVLALIVKGDKRVINACLESPTLTEGHLCKAINRPETRPMLIKLIAEHTKWSLRYSVRYALIRNFHTPMVHVSTFIKDMKTADLKELYSDRSLPSATRPFIYRELLERDETIDIGKEEIFELSDGEGSYDLDADDIQ
jgi:hypothetical protein